MQIKKTILYSFISLLIALPSFTIAQENKLSKSDQYKFDYLFYEAAQARSQKDYDTAFDYLNYCYSIDSTNSAILFELGNYYNSAGDKEKTFKMFKAAADINPENYYYGASYGTLCLELKKYNEAIEIYSSLVKRHPEKTNLYVYLAEAYRQNKDLPKAIEALNKLEQFIGLNEQISLQKFQLYSQLNQEDKAFAEIQKHIDKYPLEINNYILLGDLYLRADKEDEAFKTLTKAKSIDPNNPYLISSMASYYEKVGKQEDAESELKAAIVSPNMDIDTKIAILTDYISTLQQRGKDMTQANPLFDTLIVQHPQEAKLNLLYGNLLQVQNQKEKARAQYRLYTDANPSNPLGWEQMLSTAFPDSIKEAIKICDEAIKNVSDQPQFYFYLGLSHYIEKDYDKSLKAFQDGIVYVNEDNPKLLSDFYGQIGDLYYHTNQIDSAFSAYDKALKMNPNNLGVLNNYSYFLTLQKKDLYKAEKMSSITIKADPSNPTYQDTYGWALFAQGAYDMAKIYIEGAMENSKDDVSAEVYEHYGDVLYKTGEPEKALEYWIKAKEKGGSESKTLDRKIEKKEYIEE